MGFGPIDKGVMVILKRNTIPEGRDTREQLYLIIKHEFGDHQTICK